MKLKEWVHIVWEQVGFHSAYEILQSTIAWKHKITAVYLAALPLAAIITTLERFTENYIYTPALGIAILWLTSFCDVLLGLSVAISNKKGIVPTRISRALIRVITQTIFVGLFFQMGKAWSYLITAWMVDSLIIIFTLSTFYSVLQNAASLGLITKEQYAFIESIVNIKSLIDKLKKNESNT